MGFDLVENWLDFLELIRGIDSKPVIIIYFAISDNFMW